MSRLVPPPDGFDIEAIAAKAVADTTAQEAP